MKNLLLLLFIVATTHSNPIIFRYDGANYRTLSKNSLSIDEQFGLIIGNNKESLLLDYRFDTLSTLTFVGNAGSQINDPLLNYYDGSNTINSDHFSILKLSFESPYKPSIYVSGIYKYEDRYSQEFDKFREQFNKQNGLSLSNSDYGLDESKMFHITWENSVFNTAFEVKDYGVWGVISPLKNIYSYRNGVLINSTVNYNIDKINSNLNFSYNSYIDQVGDIKNINYKELITDIGLTYKFTDIISLGTRYSHNDKVNMEDLGLINFDMDLIKIEINGIVGGYFKGGYLSSLKSSFKINENLKSKLKLKWSFSGGEKSKEWYSTGKPILFSSDNKRYGNVETEFQYKTNIKDLKFDVTAISNYNKYPRYNVVTENDSIINIQVKSFTNNNSVNIGLTFNSLYEKKSFGLSFYGMIKKELLSDLSISVPALFQINLRIGESNNNKFHSYIEFEQKKATQQIFYYNTQKSVELGNNISSLKLRVITPFHSPFLDKYIYPRFEFIAGPIYLSDKQSKLELPNANHITPEIAISLVGEIHI